MAPGLSKYAPSNDLCNIYTRKRERMGGERDPEDDRDGQTEGRREGERKRAARGEGESCNICDYIARV